MPTLPADCSTLTEVRREIDRIDEQLIALLGARSEYVHAAALFKKDASEVAAPERQAAMLRQRREWAQREGLDPAFVETLYRDLIAYFIAREMERLKSNGNGPY